MCNLMWWLFHTKYSNVGCSCLMNTVRNVQFNVVAVSHKMQQCWLFMLNGHFGSLCSEENRVLSTHITQSCIIIQVGIENT